MMTTLSITFCCILRKERAIESSSPERLEVESQHYPLRQIKGYPGEDTSAASQHANGRGCSRDQIYFFHNRYSKRHKSRPYGSPAVPESYSYLSGNALRASAAVAAPAVALAAWRMRRGQRQASLCRPVPAIESRGLKSPQWATSGGIVLPLSLCPWAP